MRRHFFILWAVLWGSFCSLPHAAAFSVIPYRLTLNQTGINGKPLHETYTAWVVLGDYYDRFYGISDNFDSWVTSNQQWENPDLFQKILQLPYRWYGEQILSHPEIYGTHVEQIANGINGEEFPDASNSSVVVITEEGNLAKPVAMLRVSLINHEGNLASESHFLHRGLSAPLATQPLAPRMIQVPEWVDPSTITRPVSMLNELKNEKRLKLWSGSKGEIKSFAMNPKSRHKFFGYLFMLAQRHRMFHYGLPNQENEVALKKLTGNPRPGAIITDLYSDCYGRVLKRLHRSLGLTEEIDKINNEHTYGKDLFFLHANQPDLITHLRNIVLERPEVLSVVRAVHHPVISYDARLAKVIRQSNCLSELLVNSL